MKKFWKVGRDNNNGNGCEFESLERLVEENKSGVVIFEMDVDGLKAEGKIVNGKIVDVDIGKFV